MADYDINPSFIEVLRKLDRTSINLRISVKNLAANTSTLLSAFKNDRRYLGIVVTGTGRINVSVASPAVLNQGWPVAAAANALVAAAPRLFKV